jgi:hypothetical protein
MLKMAFRGFTIAMAVIMILKILMEDPLIHIIRPVCINPFTGAVAISFARYDDV